MKIGIIAKDMFFDSPKVKKALDKGTHAALSRTGAILMREAQKSFKSAPKGEPSAPGTPPHKHRGGQFHKSIGFGFDGAGVVIGPSTERGPNVPRIAALSEFGGRVRMKNPRRKRL